MCQPGNLGLLLTFCQPSNPKKILPILPVQQKLSCLHLILISDKVKFLFFTINYGALGHFIVCKQPLWEVLCKILLQIRINPSKTTVNTGKFTKKEFRSQAFFLLYCLEFKKDSWNSSKVLQNQLLIRSDRSKVF